VHPVVGAVADRAVLARGGRVTLGLVAAGVVVVVLDVVAKPAQGGDLVRAGQAGAATAVVAVLPPPRSAAAAVVAPPGTRQANS
jgi:hypothetical protein